MLKPAFLLALVAVPALAHPGDHAYLRVVVHQQDVEAELDLPATLLSPIDTDGDFLITPEEGRQRESELRSLLRKGLELSSDGVARDPDQVVVQPRSLWQKPPDDLLQRADQSVTVRAHYRWPWNLQHLRVRYAWFPASPQANCSVQASAFGQTATSVVNRNANGMEVGRPRPWLGFFWGACSPWLWLAAAGAMARARAPGVYALVTGLLLGAAGLPRSAWTCATALAVLACWTSSRPVALIGLAALWLILPTSNLIPAAGALIGLLAFAGFARRLEPDHAGLCFGLAALVSFLA